ncbi:MAG: DNA recombination protein RmuC [Endozoicomonadaceae bacterium]|nr:DNA recombination protein RmuC [Endozoicomonadaceae bacterium]
MIGLCVLVCMILSGMYCFFIHRMHHWRIIYEKRLNEKKTQLHMLRDELFQESKRNISLTERIHYLNERLLTFNQLQAMNEQLKLEISQSQSECHLLTQRNEYDADMLEKMTAQFKQLSHDIYTEKNKDFMNQTQASLTHLLVPFREQINAFKQQVETAYQEEGKERRALQNEIKRLENMSFTLSQEASNLTKALKGDNKIQGNWGELVLQTVLNESGLREGHEYLVQSVYTALDGGRVQPDIIVNLPDDKQIIIDSKVSLVDYLKYQEASTQKEQEEALRAHIRSIQTHVKQLSQKRYDTIEAIQTIDYVLLFIPIESAFYTAMDAKANFFEEALKQHILLVSPTNLLVVLKTIHRIWQYEKQSQNTQNILNQAKGIYDKLRGFTEDMLMIGKHIDKLHHSYDAALSKLKTGKGNLMKRASDFVHLGVPINKAIDEDLTVDE